ncbi:hypothetical protein BKA69DRAFT_288659 [Paraphysoderma sedebokerense]|nr:hypothetical protein BKA69DRAFT_288659 [Paraphysoderma sedebokerense]
MDQAIYSPDHQWFHSLLSHPIFNPLQSSVSPQKPRTSNRPKSKQSLHLSDISAIEQPSTLNSTNNTILYDEDTSLSSSFVSSSFISSAQASGNLKSESYVNGSIEVNEDVEFLQAVSYNLMCVRDTQLFVCVGREIRVLDLKEIKKACMSENAAGEEQNENVERNNDRNAAKFWNTEFDFPTSRNYPQFRWKIDGRHWRNRCPNCCLAKICEVFRRLQIVYTWRTGDASWPWYDC